jgi:mannosyltransferase
VPAFERSAAPRDRLGGRGATAIGVALLTAAAAASTFWDIGRLPIWLDEGLSLHLAAAGWSGFWSTVVNTETNMVGYYFLMRPWTALGGDGAAWARSLSAVFYLLTVPAMVFLGRRMYGTRAGWIAGLLFATAPMAVAYSREARTYSLLLLLVTISVLALVRAVRQPSWAAWCAWGVSWGLLPYLHVLATFTSIAMLVALAFRVRRLPLRQVAAGLAVAAVVAAPPLLAVATHTHANSNGLDWIRPPDTASSVLDALRALAGGEPGWILPIVIAVLAIVAVATRRRWETLLAACLVVVPVVLNYTTSMTVQPIWISRYMIATVPGLILLVSAALSAAIGAASSVRGRRWRSALSWLSLAAVAGLACAQLVIADPFHNRPEPDRWREAAAILQRDARPGDGLIVVHPVAYAMIHHHVDGKVVPDVLHPALPPGGNLYDTYNDIRVRWPDDIDAAVAQRERVWVLFSHASTLRDQVRATRRTLCGAHFRFVTGDRGGPIMLQRWERVLPGKPAPVPDNCRR